MKDLFGNEPMKALSWKEPYGSLMLPPVNKIETRIWPTKYRGLVLLCASKAEYPWNVVRDIAGTNQFDRILDIHKQHPAASVHGHAFAVGRLVDCRPMIKKDE